MTRLLRSLALALTCALLLLAVGALAVEATRPTAETCITDIECERATGVPYP